MVAAEAGNLVGHAAAIDLLTQVRGTGRAFGLGPGSLTFCSSHLAGAFAPRLFPGGRITHLSADRVRFPFPSRASPPVARVGDPLSISPPVGSGSPSISGRAPSPAAPRISSARRIT